MSLISCVPTALTTFRLVLLPVVWYAAYANHWTAALCVFFVAALTDVLDGRVARRFNCVTPFGALFDPFVDKIMTLSIYSIMFFFPTLLPLPLWFYVFVLVKEGALLLGALYFGVMRKEVVISAALPGKIAGAVQGFFVFFWLFCVAFWRQILLAVGLARGLSFFMVAAKIFWVLMMLSAVTTGAAFLFYLFTFFSTRKLIK